MFRTVTRAFRTGRAKNRNDFLTASGDGITDLFSVPSIRASQRPTLSLLGLKEEFATSRFFLLMDLVVDRPECSGRCSGALP